MIVSRNSFALILFMSGLVPLLAKYGLTTGFWKYLGSGILALASLLVVGALLFVDRTLPFRIALQRFAVNIILTVRGYYVDWEVTRVTKNPKKTQEDTLRDLLRTNAGTEYSRKYGLDKVSNREEFRSVHPLCKYQHFEPYCERMLTNGETNILSKEKPVLFAFTSGTTGKSNRIPFLKSQLKTILFCAIPMILNKVAPTIPQIRLLKRKMYLYFNPEALRYTADGTAFGPFTSYFFKAMLKGEVFTSPRIAYSIADETSTRYVHLLFGLRFRQLPSVDTPFASILYFVFHDMEAWWPELVKDIRDGTLKKNLVLTEEQRQGLQKHLKPDPKRADELQREFDKGMAGIAKRIWPKLGLVYTITSGAFAHYGKILKDTYFKGVPFYGAFYMATEGWLGINIWPNRHPSVWLLAPYKIFFEFIPVSDMHEEQPKTVFADEVQLNQEYELVVTSPCGLYRYRIGDVVRIEEFYNKWPVVTFLHRTGELLNIRSEKLPEGILYNSIMSAAAELSEDIKGVADFTSCESVIFDSVVHRKTYEHRAPHYVLFLELDMKNPKEATGSGLALRLSVLVEKYLYEGHEMYKYYRDGGALSPPKVFLVKPGAFERLREYLLENSSASPSQVKPPRVLKKPELVKFIFDETMHH
ncbi:hypothetical protein RvY_13281 [Ramazzottius varieornatus]|uniref:Uncharacterized protein n=1 Tax=Ramazzottius varieornatus TaxID=947166 RepID=A0A1D1VMD3_RAMVA|nr:hypothetical protein RvY_13281 [Ramazzottius varieornatus]